jgi:hypothetical protein
MAEGIHVIFSKHGPKVTVHHRSYGDITVLGVSAPTACGLQPAASSAEARYLESAIGEVTRLPDRPARKAG